MTITAQQDTKIVEPCDDPLQFHTIDQEYRQRGFLFPNMVEKTVLKTLGAFCHYSYPFFASYNRQCPQLTMFYCNVLLPPLDDSSFDHSAAVVATYATGSELATV